MSDGSESKRGGARAAAPPPRPVAPAPRDDAPPLAPGLYLVSTPIGNAADITLRALDVLRRADALAAEDTRQTRKLMEIHGVPLAGRPMIPYHDRNGPQARPRIEGWLAEGRSVAYCTDAGSPLVADPGYRLAEMAIAGGHAMTTVPGASAVLAALPLSGLPSDRFLFAGFPPPKSGERKRAFSELAPIRATLVFYESPRRLAASLADMAEVLGGARQATVARELTKLHEEVRRGSLEDLSAAIAEGPEPRGEIVVLVGPPPAGTEVAEDTLDEALRGALAEGSLKDAASAVSARLGLPRREVYARALELSRAGEAFGDD